MGNPRGLGLHLIFICAFLFAATNTCLGVGNVSVVCSEKERLALLKFKNSVGDRFGMLSSWVGNDCCLWGRIRCDRVTGNVQRLHLRGDWPYSDNYLAGNKVSSSLAELRHLKYLDLSGNFFLNSQIPEFIGSLKQLNYLNLSHAYFDGIIPPHIGNLSNLKVLDLSSNENRLKADDMAWAFGLSSLELLDLSAVDLSGAQNWDMVLHMIPSLKELSLRNCRLSNIDLGAFLNSTRILPNIKHLDLGHNSFKDPLPDLLQNMTSLTFLSLSGFNLSLAWNFPKLLSMIPSLSELHLSDCGLHKTHLSSPHLNFSALSNIQHLDLSNNPLGGTIPSFLINMSSLRVLDLSNTMLNSSLPFMPKLLELDLSGNSFKQIEHVGIWRQCHLKQLSVADNEFGMEMLDSPKNTSECSQYALELLELSGSLKGRIPETLGRLANLRDLDLSYNRLTGSIPKSLGRLRFLQVLYLSFNQLTGPIPHELGNLQGLQFLDLGDNKFSGNIPNWIGEKLSVLVVLRLHKNNFTGRIPRSLCKSSNLQILDLAYNKLIGTIPRCVGNLNGMVESHLMHGYYSNIDSDTIVIQVMKGVDLEYTTTWDMVYNMDLSSNKLVGEIPIELTALNMLVGLNLSNNHLSGGIPHNIGNMIMLESLDFSKNELSGRIPLSMAALTFLSQLNLSHNNLSGQIPTGNQLQTLTDPSIYAGNKHLCGYPLPNTCSNHQDPTTTTSKKKHKAADEQTNGWLFYVDIIYGFETGFWGVIGVLLFRKQWRQKLFMFAEEMVDRIYVAVVVRFAKFKRGREAA